MMTTHFQSHIHFFRRQALLLRFETLPFEYYRQKCEVSFCQVKYNFNIAIPKIEDYLVEVLCQDRMHNTTNLNGIS